MKIIRMLSYLHQIFLLKRKSYKWNLFYRPNSIPFHPLTPTSKHCHQFNGDKGSPRIPQTLTMARTQNCQHLHLFAYGSPWALASTYLRLYSGLEVSRNTPLPSSQAALNKWWVEVGLSGALSEISKVPVPHGLPEFSHRTVRHPVTRSCNSLGNTYFLVSFLHSPLGGFWDHLPKLPALLKLVSGYAFVWVKLLYLPVCVSRAEKYCLFIFKFME